MFLPISPSPPRGSTRRVLTLTRGGRAAGQQAVALEHRAHRGQLLLVGLDQRQAQAADVVAEQVERRLRAGRAGGQEQRLVDVLQRGVDLGAVLGLVDHAAHLIADDVAGDAECRRRRPCRACARRWRRRRHTARGRRSAAAQPALACLTPSMCSICASSCQQLGGPMFDGGAAGDVVEQDRLVGGRWRPPRSGA